MDRNEETNRSVEPNLLSADDEPRIFNLRIFRWFTIFFIGMIAFILMFGALLSGFFLPGHSIVITPAPTLLPPEPRLEVYPAQNFPGLHATQEAGLNSYGWVDRQKGIVHIPIDKAMELIAQSNLPVATGTPIAVTPSAP